MPIMILFYILLIFTLIIIFLNFILPLFDSKFKTNWLVKEFCLFVTGKK